MALDDWLESEVAVAVAATTVVLSPRARRIVRRGAVYAVAGALKATDLVTAAARGVAQGVSAPSGPATAGERPAAAPEGPDAETSTG
jgi:nucleoside phosphorylase